MMSTCSAYESDFLLQQPPLNQWVWYAPLGMQKRLELVEAHLHINRLILHSFQSNDSNVLARSKQISYAHQLKFYLFQF